MGVSTWHVTAKYVQESQSAVAQAAVALHIWCFVMSGYVETHSTCVRAHARTYCRAHERGRHSQRFPRMNRRGSGECKLTPTWPHDLQMSHQSMTSFQSGVLDAPPVRVCPLSDRIARVRLSK
jgi:hypothetical protein